ncbi:MAG: hypothetical protein GXO32_05955 [Crenarchaeota archaeon]|nr:hypothetical protein [Thermoproteota archaeon]
MMLRFLGGLVSRCGSEIRIDEECVSVEKLREIIARVCGEDPSELGVTVIASGKMIVFDDSGEEGGEVCGDARVVPVAGGG